MVTVTKKLDKLILGTGPGDDVRLAFTDALFEAEGFTDPKTGKTGEPQYSVTFLLDRNNPQARAMIEAEEERVAREKWGAKSDAILAEIRANNRGAIKKGELKASYDGFVGHDFIACNNKKRPTIVHIDGSQLSARDGVVYAGCYTIGHVTLWAQDNAFGKRINANVTGLQFTRDGDAFGGGAAPSAPDEFVNLSAANDETAAALMG